ncbi:hypothetical protein VTJ83DRAFT_5628 [Remersonia thermophila]|uniref:C2H2-type domain-containing protein n=1 Tax=Remersonia thermophila TaxID=72144 RepID=A0ABR4D7F8_9PEZI
MSVVYEPRSFIHDGGYPPMDEHQDNAPDADRFADPSDAVVNELANSVATFTTASAHPPYVPEPEPAARLQIPAAPASGPSPASGSPKEESPVLATPQRVKSIPKPEREVTRNPDGKFVCTYPSCTEEPREFTRKCEWNKHMDKHDRPYKCGAQGCEKLPGFTYSGGLLRHEREVHGKHGGPRNSYFCPHPNCKRHSGKGFSRQENLNEHLRRVHTQNGTPAATTTTTTTAATTTTPNGVTTAGATEAETDDCPSDNVTGSGLKRKRTDGSTAGFADDSDLREEIKRVRQENEELRRQVEAQTQRTADMMQKITALQQALEMRISPAATMPTATLATPAMI